MSKSSGATAFGIVLVLVGICTFIGTAPVKDKMDRWGLLDLLHEDSDESYSFVRKVVRFGYFGSIITMILGGMFFIAGAIDQSEKAIHRSEKSLQ